MIEDEDAEARTLDRLLDSIEHVALYARRNALDQVDDMLMEVMADLLAQVGRRKGEGARLGVLLADRPLILH